MTTLCRPPSLTARDSLWPGAGQQQISTTKWNGTLCKRCPTGMSRNQIQQGFELRVPTVERVWTLLSCALLPGTLNAGQDFSYDKKNSDWKVKEAPDKIVGPNSQKLQHYFWNLFCHWFPWVTRSQTYWFLHSDIELLCPSWISLPHAALILYPESYSSADSWCILIYFITL